jgi:uncharacterized protein (TIGR02270 family)
MSSTKSNTAHGEQSELLWDVIEEHFDEACFGVTQFQRMLESPALTLRDLARHPEERLIANVDGLVVAGPEALARILAPALKAADLSEPAVVTVAAWAMIEAGELGQLLPALNHELPELHDALAWAARLAEHPAHDAWLMNQIAAAQSDCERAGLLSLASARGLPVAVPRAWLEAPHPALQLAAARATVHGEPRAYLPALEPLLAHDLPEVREAALVPCLAWGSSPAWRCCVRWALDERAPSALALQLMAALGGPAEHMRIAEQLSEPAQRTARMFALGCSGNVKMAGALLPYLQGDELEAKHAAQALGMIFGFFPADDAYAAPAPPPPRTQATSLPPAEADPEAQASLPPLEADDLDADLVPSPEATLPLPNVPAITQLCEQRSQQLSANKRVLFGAFCDAAQFFHVLEVAPLRWRHTFALALAARSGGSFWLDTRGRTRIQRARLAAQPGVNLRQYAGF